MIIAPCPWTLDEYYDWNMEPRSRILDLNGRVVCDNEPYYPMDVDPNDQQLIVTAVNFYHFAISQGKRYRAQLQAFEDSINQTLVETR